VEACEAFLRTPHDKPFLLVASLINPHDICHLPLRDFMTAAKITTNTVDRSAPLALAEVDAAIKFPPGVSEQEFFEKLCPPLPPNHPVPEKELTAYMAAHRDDYLGWTRKNYDDRQWRIYRWVYDRLTERVDAQIGRILDALREAGLEENTLVVFTSDHGEMDGCHGMIHKSQFYDESARVPLLISGPGIAVGVDREHPVSTVELLPTFCDFAGISAPGGLPGRSLKPLARGNPPPDSRNFVVSENNLGRMLRTARYKYCLYQKGDPRETLFDMDADPGEMNSLAGDPGSESVLKEHRALLKDWVEKTGDPVGWDDIK